MRRGWMAAVLACWLCLGVAIPAGGFERESLREWVQRTDPPEFNGWCTGSKVDFSFVGPDWTWQRKSAVRTAIGEWETPLTNGGSKFIRLWENPTAGWADMEIDIRFDTTGALGNDLGLAECDEDDVPPIVHTGTVWLNEDLQAESLDYLASVARHEMGHIIDLHHTGDEDSLFPGGEIPTMATCLSEADWESAVLGQDDHGNLAHKESNLTYNPLFAERSFEESGNEPEYWVKSAGTWSIQTSGSLAGDQHLKWTPSGSSPYIYQDMNYVDAADTLVQARVGFKKLLSSASGLIKVEIHRRVVEYGSSPQCGYVSGQDQNDRTQGSFAFVQASYEEWTPTTTWQEKNSPKFEVEPPAGDHWDLRLRVYSTVKWNGDWVAVELDKVRIRDRGTPP